MAQFCHPEPEDDTNLCHVACDCEVPRLLRVSGWRGLQRVSLQLCLAARSLHSSQTSFDFTSDDAIIDRAACDEREGIRPTR
jgi:hypothetical protein